MSAGIIPALNFAAMRAHNSVTDAQAQPRAFASLFRGVEGIEDAFDFRDPRSVVSQANLNKLPQSSRPQANLPPPPGFFNRVVSVVQHIQEHLLKLLPAAHH